MKIVIAIWMKNMKKYRRNGMEFIGSLIQPLLWVLLFAVGMSSFLSTADKSFDYLTFVLPGMIGFTLISACIGGGTGWIDDRMNGIVKTYMAAPISRKAPLIASMLTVLTKALLQCVVIFIVGILLGATVEFELLNFLQGIILVILFGIGFSGVALYFASISPNSGAYHMVIFLFQMPLLFFSNALYTLDKLPMVFKIFVRLNPMTYFITGFRSVVSGVGESLIVPLLVLVVFAVFGMYIANNAYIKIVNQE